MAPLLSGNRIDNWIGGARRAPENGEYLESVDPSVGKPWLEIPNGDARDVDAAVAAAKAAFEGPWREMAAMQRAALLRAVAAFDRREFFGVPCDLDRDGAPKNSRRSNAATTASRFARRSPATCPPSRR